MSAGVGSQIHSLVDKTQKLETEASDAKTAAAGASTRSTMASTTADKVVKSFKQLFQKNPTLKK